MLLGDRHQSDGLEVGHLIPDAVAALDLGPLEVDRGKGQCDDRRLRTGMGRFARNLYRRLDVRANILLAAAMQIII